MSSDAQIENRRRTAEQAAFWLLTLQSEELSTAQHAELIDWLRESPLHISEMLRASLVQRDLAAFKHWQRIARLDDASSGAVIALHGNPTAAAPNAVAAPTGPATPSDPAARSFPVHHHLRNALLLAAGVAGLCLLGMLAFTRLDQTVLRTQLGERREMTLADSSVVDLAPDSELVVRYRTRERLIVLNHGEALFHVAKNPSRPFIVQAAATRVRAVGTVFNVERGDEGVSITVVEGRVSVSQQPAPAAANSPAESCATALCLGADEQVSISPAGRATSVRKVQSEAEVGWASGQLVFENETIAEIAHRFNLYNRTQIQVLDADLAARRISGIFRVSDPESFVAFIQSVAGAQVAQRDSNHIALGSQARTSNGTVQQ
jgi:transmembrane sensor